MKNSKLTTSIFIALVLGVIFGWLAPDLSKKFAPLATVFLNMIKMILAPLLFSTLVVGIAGHGSVKDLGKMGLKTLIYFEVVTTIALFIGLFVANVFKPGMGFNGTASTHSLSIASEMATQTGHQSLSTMFINLFPTSVIQAMAEGNLLQIVIFAIFFAIAITSIGVKAKPVLEVLNSLSEIMFKFTEYVMYFAPVGVFGAIASTVGENGLGVLSSYAKVLFSVYLALVLFIICVVYCVCKIVGISFRALIEVLKEPALLAFTTSCSEAALPKAMELMEKFGVPKNIVGFVMPTGYTFNLDGSTLYLSLAALFSAQIVGINLSFPEQLMIMLALMVTSKGLAAVPRVSLIVLAGTLTSFNIPLVGVAILLGIDQILDMGRTTVNLIGNCVATVFIARWENTFDYSKMRGFVREHKIMKLKKRREKIVNIKEAEQKITA